MIKVKHQNDRNQWINGFSLILRRVGRLFCPLNPINQAIKTFKRNNQAIKVDAR